MIFTTVTIVNVIIVVSLIYVVIMVVMIMMCESVLQRACLHIQEPMPPHGVGP